MTTRIIFVATTMIAIALFWAKILMPPVDCESFWHSFWHGLTISTPLTDTELDLTKNSVIGGGAGMIVAVVFWFIVIVSHIFLVIAMIEWSTQSPRKKG